MDIAKRLNEINDELRSETHQSPVNFDLFHEATTQDFFIGRPFYFDYKTMRILSNDFWKNKVGGIASGSFLVASYQNEHHIGSRELILLRVIGPTALPTDADKIASMVDFYKESLTSDESTRRLDDYTRYEFQSSGFECRVLGSFYEFDSSIRFAADVDNFYSASKYIIYKPTPKVLEYIVNTHEDTENLTLRKPIGYVRYSSSQRHASNEATNTTSTVYVSPHDYLGKRTALFGMTRTGKSNTLKMIVKSISEIGPVNGLPIGQIIFDINGEYANDNQQDDGTAIYQLYPDNVVRYSIIEKPGFQVLKVNFYRDISAGFSLIHSRLSNDSLSDYLKSFINIDWEEPNSSDRSAHTRWQRRVACYRCILYRAGFPPPYTDQRLYFPGNTDINQATGLNDPKQQGLSWDEAQRWFEWVWENYNNHEFFTKYKTKNNREWADNDLKSLLRVLTMRATPGPADTANLSGFRVLNPFRDLHTSTATSTFYTDIVNHLRNGYVAIIDLSQGDPLIQKTYSDRLCSEIFKDAMSRFISNERQSFIQMYFEEAHNLFPKKADSDLTNIYNRLAKEGAKLSIGLVYATQEVSSISSNVLKNTQNWFVSHLNNQDELKEIAKYYDFEDFIESLRRVTDKGFIRMKTYSTPFIIPVQIQRFSVHHNTEQN